MIPLSDAQMLSFFRAWPWIVSDRVAEFDDVLHRPIASVAVAQSLTSDLVGKWEAIEPEEPVSRIIGHFREMLAALEGRCEDIRKIHEWARSISLFMQELNAQRAMVIWSETFERFATGKRGPAKYIEEDVLEALSETFLRTAFKPALDFALRVRASERDWISDQGRRTEFDNVLWDHFFSEYEVDPGSVISLGYGQVLLREWWRVSRGSLSKEQIAALRLEQIDNTTQFAKSRIPEWKTDDSIREAMVSDGFPAFSTLQCNRTT